MDIVAKISDLFPKPQVKTNFGEVTLITPAQDILSTCEKLRDAIPFDTLIDICGVDYLNYGVGEWSVENSDSGFSRGRMAQHTSNNSHPERFAVVYHLLSVALNQRLRLHAYVSETKPIVNSVCSVWASANWYEREIFDLFGILFNGHEDLRRLLTDYGFIGHPLRKDFPLIGEVEVQYDETQQRVVYKPVSIEPNVGVPKVIRE